MVAEVGSRVENPSCGLRDPPYGETRTSGFGQRPVAGFALEARDDTEKHMADRLQERTLKKLLFIFLGLLGLGAVIVGGHLYDNRETIFTGNPASQDSTHAQNTRDQPATTFLGNKAMNSFAPGNNSAGAAPSDISQSDDSKPTPSNAVQQQTPPQKGTDLASIVKEWSPRVTRIVCIDSNYVSSGTGVLTRVNASSISPGATDVTALVTNKHVVTDPANGYPYASCNFQLSGTDKVIELPMSGEQVIDTLDVAWFPSSSDANAPLWAKQPMNICSASDASVGDQVLILGYPIDGGTGQASTAITATQGIISSYDGQFYVTDAKIDHGNSGGAAILVKDDCYLGIPTWVQSGGFESFGRILPLNTFFSNGTV